jgi:hypothetical protein
MRHRRNLTLYFKSMLLLVPENCKATKAGRQRQAGDLVRSLEEVALNYA